MTQQYVYFCKSTECDCILEEGEWFNDKQNYPYCKSCKQQIQIKCGYCFQDVKGKQHLCSASESPVGQNEAVFHPNDMVQGRNTNSRQPYCKERFPRTAHFTGIPGNTKVSNIWIMSSIIFVFGISFALFFAPSQLQTRVTFLQSQLDQANVEKQALESLVARLTLELQNRTLNFNDHQTSVRITLVISEFLHITGNTYRIKELLKQHGGTWLPNEKAWKIPNAPGKAEELSQAIKTYYPTENIVIAGDIRTANI